MRRDIPTIPAWQIPTKPVEPCQVPLYAPEYAPPMAEYDDRKYEWSILD